MLCVVTWQIFGFASLQYYPCGVERMAYPLERTQDIDYLEGIDLFKSVSF